MTGLAFVDRVRFLIAVTSNWIKFLEMEKESAASSWTRWASAVCIATALVLVVVLGGWGAYCDRRELEQSVLRSEIKRVRSHAERTAAQLEQQVADLGTADHFREISQEPWLRYHWKRSIPPPDRVYSAIVDQQGLLLAHSDRALENGVLCSDWKSNPVADAGPDVYLTDCRSLTGGPWALDVVVPIQYNGVLLGAYHAGASQEWIDQLIGAARRRSALGWAAVIGGIVAVVLFSSLSLHQINRRTLLLENALRQAQELRLKELNELMIGLAHEVRNPLNAVRLNLYTADRVVRGEPGFENEEVSTMLGESAREIDRVDSLLTLLLNYARADSLEIVTVDVAREIHSVVQFLNPTFQFSDITLRTDINESEEFLATAGRGEVRQVLLNLLNNARDAVPQKNGRILIRLTQNTNSIELTISDNGSGIRPEHRDRLFSPFFTTKDEGTGLGLALVRSLVERSGGRAECLSYEAGNCQFRVSWPNCSQQ